MNITPWKFCPECGHKLESEWKFCADCGKQANTATPNVNGWFNPWVANPYLHWVIPQYGPLGGRTGDTLIQRPITTWSVTDGTYTVTQ